MLMSHDVIATWIQDAAVDQTFRPAGHIRVWFSETKLAGVPEFLVEYMWEFGSNPKVCRPWLRWHLVDADVDNPADIPKVAAEWDQLMISSRPTYLRTRVEQAVRADLARRQQRGQSK
jgi:hypothetical protein